MTNVKKIGNEFEKDFTLMLKNAGFWAHLMKASASGQPADVIAAKNNTACLIDCKTCEDDIFKLSRVEPNQITAMKMWRGRVNSETWFALKLHTGEVKMLDYELYLAYVRKGIKSIDKFDMRNLPTFQEWADAWEVF